jgi:hypothetical protein
MAAQNPPPFPRRHSCSSTSNKIESQQESIESDAILDHFSSLITYSVSEKEV